MTIGNQSFNLRPADFCPFNSWSNPLKVHLNESEGSWVVDSTTKRLFCNDSKCEVWVKLVGISILVSPIMHPILLVYGIAKRVFNIFTGYYFESEKTFTAKSVVKDLLWIVATPLFLLGFELAAIYGVISFSPYNGRKLYGNMERAVYGEGILPCMKPNDKYYYSPDSPNKIDCNTYTDNVNSNLKIYSNHNEKNNT